MIIILRAEIWLYWLEKLLSLQTKISGSSSGTGADSDDQKTFIDVKLKLNLEGNFPSHV